MNPRAIDKDNGVHHKQKRRTSYIFYKPRDPKMFRDRPRMPGEVSWIVYYTMSKYI